MLANFFDAKLHLGTVVLALITSVSACGVSARENLRVDWVVSGENQIAVTSEIFKVADPIGVKYTDIWQSEEYLLLKAGGRQLEMIYATVSKAFTVALEYRLPIKTMVSTWRHNSKQSIVWGPLGRIDNRLGTWFYRTYELSPPERPCFGFLISWDQIYEDPQAQPGKVLFGCYCGTEGERLADREVRRLIGGILIRTQGGRSGHGFSAPDTSGSQPARSAVMSDSADKSALAFARGNDSADVHGNPGFPFKFARYYNPSNGRKPN